MIRSMTFGEVADMELSMNQRTCARKPFSRILPILGAVCLTMLLAVPVTASSPGREHESEQQAAERANHESGDPSRSTRESMTTVVDPETGEAVARLPLQKADGLSVPLAKALDRSTDGLHLFELANGGRGMHLDGRFQHVLMVRVKADGSLETVCVNHAHEAEKFLKRSAAEVATQPPEK